MVNYGERFVEVDEILKHLSKNDYNKIPKEIIDIIKNNKAVDYTWRYDESKKLKNQDISDETIAIISYINMEYLLNEKQRAFVEELHRKNEQIKNSSIGEYRDIFSKENKNAEANSLVEYKESFIKKIIKKIKSIFSKQ